MGVQLSKVVVDVSKTMMMKLRDERIRFLESTGLSENVGGQLTACDIVVDADAYESRENSFCSD